MKGEKSLSYDELRLRMVKEAWWLYTANNSGLPTLEFKKAVDHVIRKCYENFDLLIGEQIRDRLDNLYNES